MHLSITASLILATGAAFGVEVPDQEAATPATLTTAPDRTTPPAIEVFARTGRELLQTSTASPRMRAAATGWLDSIRPGPGFATRFESLESRERIAAYLDARFEAELLRGGMLEPTVLEALEAIPAGVDGRGELQWSLAGLLFQPPPDLPSGRDLDCTFRLGPTRAPIIDFIAVSASSLAPWATPMALVISCEISSKILPRACICRLPFRTVPYMGAKTARGKLDLATDQRH